MILDCCPREATTLFHHWHPFLFTVSTPNPLHPASWPELQCLHSSPVDPGNQELYAYGPSYRVPAIRFGSFQWVIHHTCRILSDRLTISDGKWKDSSSVLWQQCKTGEQEYGPLRFSKMVGLSSEIPLATDGLGFSLIGLVCIQ